MHLLLQIFLFLPTVFTVSIENSLLKLTRNFLPLHAFDSRSHTAYAVIIDAGSSGSRAIIYSWNPKESSAIGHGLPIILKGNGISPEWTFKEYPGISSFAGNASNVNHHMKPLLDFAFKVVPSNQHKDTPVYLYATAGMRLVPSGEQNTILTEACKFTRLNYDFSLFGGCEQHFRVISGDLEGIFGWLAVNYLKDKFQSKFASASTSLTKSTFGFMDLGGASMQVAFEPTQEMAIKHQNDLTTVVLRTLSGQEVKMDVSVSTFLGFGVNEARKRYIESISHGGSTQLNNDRDAHINTSSWALDDHCLPNGLEIKDAARKTLKGSGNFAQCVNYQRSLLNKEKACPDLPCMFDGVHFPLVSYQRHIFIGVSEYWYTLDTIFKLGNGYSAQAIFTKAQDFCSQPWDKMQSTWLSSISIERLQLQCFKTAWIINLLHNGLEIPWDSAVNSKFEAFDEIDGFPISWTMGALLLFISSSVPQSHLLPWIFVWVSGALIFAFAIRKRLKLTNFFTKTKYSSVQPTFDSYDLESVHTIDSESNRINEFAEDGGSLAVSSSNYFSSKRRE